MTVKSAAMAERARIAKRMKCILEKSAIKSDFRVGSCIKQEAAE
jgi:hypothetical protein